MPIWFYMNHFPWQEAAANQILPFLSLIIRWLQHTTRAGEKRYANDPARPALLLSSLTFRSHRQTLRSSGVNRGALTAGALSISRRCFTWRTASRPQGLCLSSSFFFFYTTPTTGFILRLFSCFDTSIVRVDRVENITKSFRPKCSASTSKFDIGIRWCYTDSSNILSPARNLDQKPAHTAFVRGW